MTTGEYSIRRELQLSNVSTQWADDIVMWWERADMCQIEVMTSYENADARLVLRREDKEHILAAGLGNAGVFLTAFALQEDDEIALQWRALSPRVAAISVRSQLAIQPLDPKILVR